MERIRSLGRYQKGILILMAAMILLFTALYPIVLSREGFLYRDALLIPSEEGGNTVYAGKIEGEPASFTLYDDHSVEFRYGDATYGPYTAREDASALPADSELGDGMVGVELRCGERVVFRGGVMTLGGEYVLYNEDGSTESIGVLGYYGDGAGMDPAAQEPTAAGILQVMAGPALTHKGVGLGWLCGMVLCVLTVCEILFANEIFRWELSLRIRRVEGAEPSEWEISRRYLVWTLFPILALVAFVLGLQ